MGAAFELTWEQSYGAVTIEAICERAGVKKGSFYYFFNGKSDLAIASIETGWAVQKARIDEMFHPDMPPLERIRKYLDTVAQDQIRGYEAGGRILGCPVFTLGSEISTQNERIRLLIHGILASLTRYFEQAIGEAQALGEIEGANPKAKACALLSYFEGALARARIENDPELIRELGSDAIAMLKGRSALAAA